MASVPVTVIDALPLEPDVKVSPVVDANVSVPSVTESVSESEVADATTSVSVIALPPAVEKTSDAFSLTPAFAGAPPAGLTAMATVAEPLRPSPSR